MQIISFYGYSDDCLEVAGHKSDSAGVEVATIRDEISCHNCVGSVALISESEGGLRVTAIYAPNDIADTWCIGVSPLAENTPIPKWQFNYTLQLSRKSAYSARLEIQCPDDAKLIREEFDSEAE